MNRQKVFNLVITIIAISAFLLAVSNYFMIQILFNEIISIKQSLINIINILKETTNIINLINEIIQMINKNIGIIFDMLGENKIAVL